MGLSSARHLKGYSVVPKDGSTQYITFVRKIIMGVAALEELKNEVKKYNDSAR
jgi:hypothetical protein